MALEGRRLDQLEQVLSKAGPDSGALRYALRVAQETVVHRSFRQQVSRRRTPLQQLVLAPCDVARAQPPAPRAQPPAHACPPPPPPQVLRLLIRLAEAAPQPDWVDICQCLMILDDAPEVAKILNKLIAGSEVGGAVVVVCVCGGGGGGSERTHNTRQAGWGRVCAEPTAFPAGHGCSAG